MNRISINHVAFLLFTATIPMTTLTQPAKPAPFYLNIASNIPTGKEQEYVTPGQLRISQTNADMKMNQAQAKGGFKYNNGTSILAPEQALPVIKAPFGYVLVDGHHETVASLKLADSLSPKKETITIPVKVVDDLSAHGDKFWRVAKERGYVYPFDLKGDFATPTNFQDLKDDPNRYFAAISARKCESEGQDPEKSTGAEYPLWIKVGKDIPFIEFMISDALNNAGLIYDSETMKDPKALNDFTEKARSALRKELAKLKRKNPPSPLLGLKFVPKKTHIKKLIETNPYLCTKQALKK